MKQLRHLLLSLVIVGTPALAQEGLQTFLTPVKSYPSVQAAAAAFSAAQAQLDGAYDPVAVSLSAGFSAFDNDDIDVDPDTPGTQGLPGTGGQFSTEVALRPFAFGDIKDLVDRRQVNVQQALLDYRNTLTSLEVQALEAALGVRLAENSLELAREGAALAETSLETTRLRLERGAATERDLRDAEANLQEAQNFAQRAESQLELARLRLRDLVGEVEAPELPELPLVDGTPLSVVQAQLSVALAEIGPRSATREVIPVVQAGYTFNMDDSNSLGVSVESRTLQPTVSYEYQDPERTFPQTAQNGSFQAGISLNFSPSAFKAIEAAEDQLVAAQSSLNAAQNSATIQRQSLETELELAQRDLALEELQFRNAQADFEEAQRREELGLSTSVETQAQLLDLLEEDQELRAARQDVLNRTLDFYELYAIPVSEVIE